MSEGLSFPQPLESDPEDVSWALSTGSAMWTRGDHAEAVRWVKRASESAADAGDDDWAFALARAAADLKAAAGSVAPPPPAPEPEGAGSDPAQRGRPQPAPPAAGRPPTSPPPGPGAPGAPRGGTLVMPAAGGSPRPPSPQPSGGITRPPLGAPSASAAFRPRVPGSGSVAPPPSAGTSSPAMPAQGAAPSNPSGSAPHARPLSTMPGARVGPPSSTMQAAAPSAPNTEVASTTPAPAAASPAAASLRGDEAPARSFEQFAARLGDPNSRTPQPTAAHKPDPEATSVAPRSFEQFAARFADGPTKASAQDTSGPREAMPTPVEIYRTSDPPAVLSGDRPTTPGEASAVPDEPDGVPGGSADDWPTQAFDSSNLDLPPHLDGRPPAERVSDGTLTGDPPARGGPFARSNSRLQEREAAARPQPLGTMRVWVTPSEAGPRIVPIANARPAGAIEAVIVTAEGATLEAWLTHSRGRLF